MRIGAIDIGSNSIRLLVADFSISASPQPASTIARAGEICRLGRGLHQGGAIAAELAGSAARIVAEFQRRALSLGAQHVIVGATAALRSAANGAEVAQRIERETGLTVRVLSGDDEARLVYRAVALGLGSPVVRSHCVVFDLGGGSTEIVSGVGAEPGRWVSLPLGAVGLTERFLHSDPAAQAEVSGLVEHIAESLMHGCASFPAKASVLAGVGGTVTVLASLDRGIRAYDPLLLEGWSISADKVAALVGKLTEATHEQRRSWSIIGEGRADIVVAGAIVVNQLMARFAAPALTCSTQGLRYGLARLAAEEQTGKG